MNEGYLLLVGMQFLWLVGLTVLNFARRPGEDAAKAAAAAIAAADQIRGRVDKLETHMEHMPSMDELTKLEGTVQAIQATLQGLQISQQAVQNTLSRVEQYLLNSKRV